MILRCDFEVITVSRDAVTIRDLDRGKMSVTHDASAVVAELRRCELLLPGRRLFYYDSMGVLDEIVWTEDGAVAFAPGPNLANSKRLNCRAKCAECKRWCVWRSTAKHAIERHSELFPFLCADCARLFERKTANTCAERGDD
jgi:hypothetical protein